MTDWTERASRSLDRAAAISYRVTRLLNRLAIALHEPPEQPQPPEPEQCVRPSERYRRAVERAVALAVEMQK